MSLSCCTLILKKGSLLYHREGNAYSIDNNGSNAFITSRNLRLLYIEGDKSMNYKRVKELGYEGWVVNDIEFRILKPSKSLVEVDEDLECVIS